MKTLFLITALLFTACTTRTEYGHCVGLSDDRDPKLHYKVSVWNVFLGVAFVETIIVPIIVVVDDLYCPVGEKNGN